MNPFKLLAENRRLTQERDDWKEIAVKKNKEIVDVSEAGDYWRQVAEYYKEQWELSLQHVPQEIKEQFIPAIKERH